MMERELWVIFVTSNAPTGKSPCREKSKPWEFSVLFIEFWSISSFFLSVKLLLINHRLICVFTLCTNKFPDQKWADIFTHAVFYCQGNVQNVFKCFFKHLFISLLGLLEAFLCACVLKVLCTSHWEVRLRWSVALEQCFLSFCSGMGAQAKMRIALWQP